MNPFQSYEGPRTRYPAARLALNFLSFLMLIALAFGSYQFPFGTADGVPTAQRTLIAIGIFVVALCYLIVQYWILVAILDIADDFNKYHAREDLRDMTSRETQSQG